MELGSTFHVPLELLLQKICEHKAKIPKLFLPLVLPARNFNADGIRLIQFGTLKLHGLAEQDDDDW